jgi:hypothetical protein
LHNQFWQEGVEMQQVAVAVITSVITAAVTSFAALAIQERRLRRDFALDRERVRTEFMAEQVTRELLESERWEKRTFRAIQQRLKGFDGDELRKILVRAGAVAFEGDQGEELWGLLSRNRREL